MEYDMERLVGDIKSEIEIAQDQRRIQESINKKYWDAEEAMKTPFGLDLEKAFFIKPEEKQILKRYVGILASNHVSKETLPYRIRQEEYRTLTLKKRTTPVADTESGYVVPVCEPHSYETGRVWVTDESNMLVTPIYRLYSVGKREVARNFKGPYMVDFIARDVARRGFNWPK